MDEQNQPLATNTEFPELAASAPEAATLCHEDLIGEAVVAGPAFAVPLARAAAPIWHTVLLVVGILAFSAWGSRTSGHILPNAPLIEHYLTTGLIEAAIALWVLFGLHLTRTPILALLGSLPHGAKAFFLDMAAAAIFWVVAMAILGSIGVTWMLVENRIYQVEQQHAAAAARAHHLPPPAKRLTPEQEQVANSRNLMRLAPSNLAEGALWGCLCLLVGFSEELVFRGYLMAQGLSLTRRVALGTLFSALVFGAAHGYEGLRGMVTIGVYGALFSLFALYRRSLFPGMLTHAWHDFATGIALAVIRATHLLDKLPAPH